ncbi:unnamed protein product [Auanema sp. JU1783]|nr:unnamed protein product [Auanema sp. JU1783]
MKAGFWILALTIQCVVANIPITFRTAVTHDALPAPGSQQGLSASPAPKRVERSASRGCPLSPFARHLSDSQQQTLHELIIQARGQGADEPTVKEHINKYLQEIMSPQEFAELQEENRQFELHRISKRHAEEKQQPQKVYDLLDQYSGDSDNMYAKFYEEYNAKKIRQFS